MPLVTKPPESAFNGAMQGAKVFWRRATARLDILTDLVIVRFREAQTGQRAIYVAAVVIPLLLLIALLTNWAMHAKVPAKPNGMVLQAENTTQSSPATAHLGSAPADSKVKGQRIKCGAFSG